MSVPGCGFWLQFVGSLSVVASVVVAVVVVVVVVVANVAVVVCLLS